MTRPGGRRPAAESALRASSSIAPTAEPVLPHDVRSIVLVRLRSIGDAVLMTPLLAALRAGRPGAALSVVLEEPQASLLSGHPDLDRVIAARRGALGRLRTLAEVRALAPEVVLDLHGGPTAALLTRLSGARLRIGLESFRSARAYDVRLPSPFKGEDRSVTLHTLASNRAIAVALGLDPVAGRGPGAERVPRLALAPAWEEEADRALAAIGASRSGFVVIHPGAALASKAWPRERFLAVAGALAARGHQVLLARPLPGSPGEPPASAVEPPASGVLALPLLSLGALAALFGRARLFVGNDSGPAHVAAATGVPTVTVFGSQDPRVWSPAATRGRVLWKGLACSPCPGFTCANPVSLECLNTMTEDEVLSAALDLLGAPTD